MITGWLVKLVLGFVLAGLIAFEAGSPLLTRFQLDDVAHDAADSAAADFASAGDADRARRVAEEIVVAKDAVLESFSVDETGVRLTIGREARSLVLKNLEQAESWYDVEVSASASGRGG